MEFILNTLFLIFSFVLIILMVPGFAMLEAGLVRSKNVVTVLSINTVIYLFASFIFFLIGYHIAFGEFKPLNTVSEWAFFLFQLAFVGKTINIVSGGVSERVRILPIIIFTLFMGGIIYPIIVNLTWGSNFLKDTIFDISKMHDLAGSGVIHATGGFALLAALLIIGNRRGKYIGDKIKAFPASNIPLIFLGTFLLWIGWFGFNGGSIGSISTKENADLFAYVVMNTNNAGIAGGIGAFLFDYLRYKKFDITMVLNGALGGLVAITAGADVFGIYESLIVGFIGGVLVIFFVPWFEKKKIDDPVGALSVHLINGIWGVLAVGIFGYNSFTTQLKGIIEIGIISFGLSFIVLYSINKLIPFRVSEDEEIEGLDVSECGIEAYPEFKKYIR